MGLAIGMDTAITALRAMQLAVDTTAHNVANASTEGYSRQEVVLRAIPPAAGKYRTVGVPQEQLGLGVDSNRIRRMRDLLLDVQYRGERGLRDEYDTRAAALDHAQLTLNEPSDQGIQALLSRFFNAFRELSNQPESVSARSAAVEQATTLTAALNRVGTLLNAQRLDLNTSLEVRVADVNAKAKEVADLNAQIRVATVSGSSSNDLHDRRDLILDELAGLTGATFETGQHDIVNVSIGGHLLVEGASVTELAVEADPGNGDLFKVIFTDDNSDALITTGEIHGLLVARDDAVAGLIDNLNGMVSALATAFNAHHQSGYGLDNSTGLDFFIGATLTDIGVNQALRDDPQKLATADVPDEPGNTNGARALANVQHELLMSGGTATLDDGYRTLVAKLGVSTQQAHLLAENQDVLVTNLDQSRQAVMGVSIDEEMSNLVKYQHAYNAAARIISVVDSMLDSLVNGTR